MFFVGIFIHLTFLFSIFDIYFKSPIVNNVVPYQPQFTAVAERLVLFVVDGLRAESFVNYTTMAYLRSVANSNGRWGISYTQVPTESRPGHVALLAGFYEDPSAVAKGWKENPVDFDSVLNHTAHGWCWGTYDIVNIFTKGHVGNHIEVNSFDPYNDTFSTDKNTTLLDKWVFDKVEQFFYNAKHDDNLKEKLNKQKIAFFLHLLGTDTSGHKHKPKTKNFLTTLRFVDEGIKEIEKVIRNYYGDDGKTTFLVTSDHGMTDWGSHGSGDDHETQTPYILWGSGVKQIKGINLDPTTLEMFMEHRFDLNQVDLSPLMSTILSIPIPVNSIGQLKAEVLNMTLSNKARAIYSNSRQLASQYDKRRKDVENNALSILYFPFKEFNKDKYEKLIHFTEKLLAEEQYEKLILYSEDIIRLSLLGLKYYHNYYQSPLLVLVTLSFLGWTMCLLKILLKQQVKTHEDTAKVQNFIFHNKTYIKKTINLYFCIVSFIAVYVVYVQSLPVQYYLYSLMPILIWWYVLSSLSIWMQAFVKLKRNKQLCNVLIQIISYSLGSIFMGLSFSYRWLLSIPLFGMALWPFISTTKKHLTKALLLVWFTGCLSLSIFSFIPVVGKDVFIELVILAGLIWIVSIVIYIQRYLLPLYYSKEESKKEICLITFQIILMCISLHNIYVQSKRFEHEMAVSHFYQSLSWIISIISWILPLISSKRLICRLLSINTSVLNFYLLLSVCHEGLFMVILICNVICWILIEFRLLHMQNMKILECTFGKGENEKIHNLLVIERGINNQDFRRGFFCLLYIILAFFGTGNIASVNSFEIRWVICFTTSFQPFIITTLILLKTLSPFLIVGCSFRAVQLITKAPAGYLNIIVLIYSNIMGVQMMFNVKNTGSWLEIGTSISQFVIVQVITLFIVLITQVAKILTNVSIADIVDKMFDPQKKQV